MSAVPKTQESGFDFKPSKLEGPSGTIRVESNWHLYGIIATLDVEYVTKAGRSHPSGTPAVRMPSIRNSPAWPPLRKRPIEKPGSSARPALASARASFGAFRATEHARDRVAGSHSPPIPTSRTAGIGVIRALVPCLSARVVVAARAFAPRYDELFGFVPSIQGHDVSGTGWRVMGCGAMQSITPMVPVWQCGHSRNDRPVSASKRSR